MAYTQTISEIINVIQALEPDEARAVIRSAKDLLYLQKHSEKIDKVISTVKESIGVVEINLGSDESRIAAFLCVYFLNVHYAVPLRRMESVFKRKRKQLDRYKSVVDEALQSKRRTGFEEKLYNFYLKIHTNI